MKITKKQLKQIIKEEINKLIEEENPGVKVGEVLEKLYDYFNDML